VIARNHENPEVERVVDENGRFAVVETITGLLRSQRSRAIRAGGGANPGEFQMRSGTRVRGNGSLGGTRSTMDIAEDRLGLIALAETLSDAVVGALDGRVHTWNAGAEQLFGYGADEILGKPVSILYPPECVGELEEILAHLSRGEAIKELETIRRRKDGTDVEVSLSISPVRDASWGTVGLAIVHDISERKRREHIQSFLAEASRLLAASLDYRETLSRVAELTLANLADHCLIETAEAPGSLTEIVAIAHRDPDKAELASELHRLYPSDTDHPNITLRVLTTGRAELIPEVSDALLKSIATSTQHLRRLRDLGLRSLIVVPLHSRGRTCGTILLANADGHRRFGRADLDMAEELARRAALAIENATLYESQREARRKAEQAARRISTLQAVTAALSAAVTRKAIARVVVDEGAAAVGADGGFVRLLTHDGHQLELFAATGLSEPFLRSSRTPLTSGLPDAEVARTGVERYFESAAGLRAAAPELGHDHETTVHEAIAFMPLFVERRPIGVMALSFAGPRTFDDEHRELLRTVAGQCSQALERARLYEAERQARAAAERAVHGMTRLQSLAAELAEALTPAQVAKVVVTHGVASIHADAGALQRLTDDQEMLVVVNGQGSDSSLIQGTWRRFSTDLAAPSAEAVRSLEPVFVESEKDTRENYHGELGSPFVRVRAGAHIPLVVSGRPLGVLFLGFTNPKRFSEQERSFVLALARQCAQALSRAVLYEAELEGRSKLSRLVEGLHEGVVSVDRHGQVEFASSTAKSMLSPERLDEGGYMPDSWLGFPLSSFVAGISESEKGVVEAQVRSSDGERVFEITGIPSSGSDTALVVIHDVSDRERRLRAEREFLSNASHELRTPLSAIASAIERLQGEARENPGKRDRFLGHIQRESDRLNRLVSSLLVLARAQAQHEEPSRAEIVLRDLLAEMTGELGLRPGVELVLDCPADLRIWSSRELLEHAVGNLASNAARNTERGQVRFSARVGDSGSVVIEVSDTGSGIPPEGLSRLFERFYRGPGERDTVGVGLGLPIVKDAVEAIGGQIVIDSVAGGGTTAKILLPRDAVPVHA
jgi:PAS domain S-box-containing protein